MKGASIFDHSMFQKKSMEHMEATAKSTHALKRVLKPFDLVMLGIGGIIGTGIFVLSGVVIGHSIFSVCQSVFDQENWQKSGLHEIQDRFGFLLQTCQNG